MRFRLELLQRFSLVDTRSGVEIPLRRYADILSALGFADRPLSRDAIIAFVWPSVESSVGRNRLRVALTNLRKLIPDAIEEGPDGLELSPTLVGCDVREARAEIRLAENTVTEETELGQLLRALALAGDGSFVESWTEEFCRVVTTACLRAASMAIRLGKDADATKATILAITLDPGNPQCWRAYLEASRRVGKGDEAIHRLRSLRNPELLEDEGIDDLVKQIRLGQSGGADNLSNPERHLVIELFETLAVAQPELCRKFLSTPHALPLSGKHPRQMHDILRRIVNDPEEKTESWERCMARMVGLKAWLNDAAGVLETAPLVLETSTNPIVQRAVWSAVSIGYSLLRRWPEAMDALDRTMAYATGDEIGILSTRGNRAFFLMQQNLLHEAEAEYEVVLSELAKIDTPRAEFEYIIGIGNRAFIPIFQGEWELARERLSSAIELRSRRKDPMQMGLLQAALALSKMKLRDREGVLPLMRAAFVDAFSSDSARNEQITFEFAAGALLCTGQKGYGMAVLNWVDGWRCQVGLPRGEAESRLCTSLVGATKSSSSVRGEPTEVGREMMRRLRRELE